MKQTLIRLLCGVAARLLALIVLLMASLVVAPAQNLEITTDPRSQSVALGGSATFSVSATGTGTLRYQWFKDNVALTGKTERTLAFVNATTADIGLYHVDVSDDDAIESSNLVLFFVLLADGAPFTGSDSFSGTHDPSLWAGTNIGSVGTLVRTGGRLEFRNSSTAFRTTAWLWKGRAPYGQDWEARVTVNVPNLSFTPDSFKEVSLGLGVLNSADPGDGADFFLNAGLSEPSLSPFRSFSSVADVDGPDEGGGRVESQTTSTKATLRVRWVASTTQLHFEYDADGPANGDSWTTLRTFNPANATTNWRMSSSDSFLLGLVGNSDNRIIESTDGVFLDDFSASIAGASAPTITSPPQNQVAIATSNVTFTAAATGNGLTYQWRKGVADIPSATSTTLTLTNVTRAASGTYSVVVTSGASAATSNSATLRVIVPQQLSFQRGSSGQFQLLFNDPDGALGSDLLRFEVHHTTSFLGASTSWVTNSGGFTSGNGKILFDDTGSGGATRRFYRVIEK